MSSGKDQTQPQKTTFDLCNMLIEQHRTRVTNTPRYVLFDTMMTTTFSNLKSQAANTNSAE